MDKEQSESKLGKFLDHPVTRKVAKVATYTTIFVAGVAFGSSQARKKALSEAGLPTAQ